MRQLICAVVAISAGSACGDNRAADHICHQCAADAVCSETAPDPCACPVGHAGDGTVRGSGCADIDECAAGTDDCVDSLAACENTEGGYICTCIAGLAGDGTAAGTGCSAGEMGECADGCVVEATCIETAGGHACACGAGYAGDGSVSGTGCTDIDECATGTDDCVDVTGICTDSDGSFACGCITGYAGDGTVSGTGCTDIDECAAGTDDCGTLDCVDSDGSFACAAWFMPQPRQAFISRMDGSFAFLDRVRVTTTSGSVSGVMSLALDPTSSDIHAIVRVGGNRLLATIDPSTGSATEKGNLGAMFASLAFDGTGQLWGVTGSGAAPPSTLYRIDKSNATTTLARALATGAGGQCIAYHPTQNVLYHWSGNSSVAVERVDLGTPGLDTTPVATTGTYPVETFGCLYDAGLDLFLLWGSDRTVRTMTAGGAYGTTSLLTFAAVRTSLHRPTSRRTVTPSSGPIAGGTAITVTGLGLDQVGASPALTVGGAAATDVVVVNATTITAVTPAGAAGAADLVVTGTGPPSYSWPGGFTYDASLREP